MAVVVVLAALVTSGSAPDREAAEETHGGGATANVPTPSPTARAVPDPPRVVGPGLRSQDTAAIRLETAPPPRGSERSVPGEHGRDLGTGSSAHGASRATTDRLPQPPDAILDTTTAAPAARAGAEPEASLQACVDRELATRGLNGFGDPPATTYPGGTPVDSASVARYDYVLRRSPGIRGACQTTTPFR